MSTQDHEAFKMRVKGLVQEYEDLWWDLRDGGSGLERVYPYHEKFIREAAFNQFLSVLDDELGSIPKNELTARAKKERLVSAFGRMLRSALDFEASQVDALISAGLLEVAGSFAEMARRFDPAISPDDIYQASRNVWTMNFLQLMLGLPVVLTPAMFAYSMLYPYSDNYLDDGTVEPTVKRAFNRRFRQRLQGLSIEPENAHEERIWSLVGMVEDQYARAQYPCVFESLLAIQDAQAKSLSLIQPGVSPFEIDILGISLEKGGTAVLADGYLVAGELTPDQEKFMFGYGAFTQLMDDQEDVLKDRQIGLMTIFSQTAGRWRLDQVATHTIHLAEEVLDRLKVFNSPGIEAFKTMMRRSILLLLVDAIGRTGELYSRRYYHEMEGVIPLRFSYLKGVRRRFGKKEDLFRQLFETLIGMRWS